MNVDRVVRDGKVAVMICNDYGGNWVLENKDIAEVLLFHPKLVAMIENGEGGNIGKDTISSIMGKEYNGCVRGCGVCICWIPVGVEFRIGSYDCSEYIEIKQDIKFYTA